MIKIKIKNWNGVRKLILGLFLSKKGRRRKFFEIYIPRTFTVAEVSDLRKKKGKRKKKWFAIYCQGHSSGERPIKTNDPLESPTLAKSRKKEGRWKSKARTRYTRDARNAPCSNRFSTVARSSLTNQTLTSADASRQSNLSRKTLRRGQDDEWSELPRAFLFLEKLPNFVFYCTNLLSIFDQSRINVYTYLIFD